MRKISRRVEYSIVVLVIFLALAFSLRDFLVSPAYWFDEAITIEIARNFYLFGELDILTAPGVFSGVSYIAGTNGYPLTIPLAAVFYVTGFGLAQARIFMMVWLVVCLLVIYGITKKIYGVVSACAALLLVATFASFYGNGLTTTGEVPGFVFFLSALFLAAYKKDYALAGVCTGLAMAAKPGVYLFLAHAMVLFILFMEQGTRIKSFARFTLGLIPPLMLWILLAFPLSRDTFFSTLVYALNPLDIPGLRTMLHSDSVSNLGENLIVASFGGTLAQVQENTMLLLTSSTGIYFSLIAFMVLLMLIFGKNKTPEQKRFLQLSLVYGAFAVAYFLRGPGWIRYLFGFQILFLILLFPSLKMIAIYLNEKYSESYLPNIMKLPVLCIIVLASVQTYHLLYLSNIPRSKAALNLISYAENRAEKTHNFTFGLVNVPEVAAFSDPARTYHMIWLQRTMPPFGRQFLNEGVRPDMIITDGKNFLLGKNGQEILQSEYRETTHFGRYALYEIRKN